MKDVPKRLKEIVELAETKGWKYDTTTKGHPRLTPPEGTINQGTGQRAYPVTFSGTLGDNQRGDANQVALLRRCGVEIPSRKHTAKKGQRK